MSELSSEDIGEIVNIGGGEIINQCLETMPESCKYIIYTRINQKFECDTFVSKFPDYFKPIHISKTFVDNGVPYDIVIYGNMPLLIQSPELIPTRLFSMLPRHEEYQYLDMIRDIIDTGNYKGD
jgi:hypothetical protein